MRRTTHTLLALLFVGLLFNVAGCLEAMSKVDQEKVAEMDAVIAAKQAALKAAEDNLTKIEDEKKRKEAEELITQLKDIVRREQNVRDAYVAGGTAEAVGQAVKETGDFVPAPWNLLVYAGAAGFLAYARIKKKEADSARTVVRTIEATGVLDETAKETLAKNMPTDGKKFVTKALE